MPDRCHHGQSNRSLIEGPAVRGTADATAAAQTGVAGDGLRALRRAARIQPGDLGREPALELHVLVHAAPGVPFATAQPSVCVGQALLLGLVERRLFHEEALPLVALAGPTPPHDDGGEPAGLFRPPGQCGVAGRQEDQVVHVRAAHAQRTRIVHGEQVARAVATVGAGEVLDGLDDHADQAARTDAR